MAAVCLLSLSMQRCYYDVEEEIYGPVTGCDTIPPTFTNSIEAITAANCATQGCHGGLSPAAGLFLETYPQVKAIADNGRLMERAVVQRTMPPTQPLSECDRLALEAWILAGAPQ